jgi:hypothetical protein
VIQLSSRLRIRAITVALCLATAAGTSMATGRIELQGGRDDADARAGWGQGHDRYSLAPVRGLRDGGRPVSGFGKWFMLPARGGGV